MARRQARRRPWGIRWTGVAARGTALAVVAVVVVIAAALRFATLHIQSYDYDELQTVRLLRMHFGSMLTGVARDESTPPLYYILAWAWGKAFGTGETGLRALSALFGTATVAVVYAAAKDLASRRAAVLAALLCALSPWFVWYSQEARGYALVALLASISFWCFVRARDAPAPRALAGWALASGLAICAHYFALFIVLPEALWLTVSHRWRPHALAPVAAVAAVAAALLPLALYQRGQGHADTMVAQSGSLALRTAQVVKQSLIAYDAPVKLALAAAALALVGVGLVLLLWRGESDERHTAQAPAAIALSAVALPLALAIGGLDYVVARNLIVMCVPALIVIAIGLSVRRAVRVGAAAGISLCAVFATATISVAVTPGYQRDDWRGAARSLGPPTITRVLVVTPPSSPEPFAVYLPSLRRLGTTGARVREIDVVTIANTTGRVGHGRALPPLANVHPPLPGFIEFARKRGALYLMVRFRSRLPVTVDPLLLRNAGPQKDVTAADYLQPAPR
jgi:4-amino-4-deoxy-L-arabinose transferase-like glycosyltransferase